MLSRAVLMMKVVLILLTSVQAAPVERDFMKPPDLLPGLTVSSDIPERSSVQKPAHYMKRWPLGTKTAGIRVDSGLDKRDQMLKMISALEELHRMFNGTRLTILPRANGRNSARRNKAPPEGGASLATTAPAASDSTASGASGGVIIPSLSGRNFRKSLPPQSKKTNKRVCFWKYCAQN